MAQQSEKIDSLKKMVSSHSIPDTTRINALGRLISFYTNSNVDTAIVLAKQMLYLSRKNHLKKREVDALNKLGGAYEKYNGVEPDSIIAIFQEALDIAEEIDYVELKTHLLNNMGVINLNKGEYDKTIRLCLEALEIAEEIELDVSILQSLNLISAVFYYQKENEKGLKYAKQGLAHARRVNDPQYIANFINNIGSFYKLMGMTDSTLIYMEQSLEVSRANNMDIFTVLTLNNIGEVYISKNRFEIAQQYVSEAYAIAQKSNYVHGMFNSLVALAQISYDGKQYHEAINYLERSLELTTKQNSKKDAYEILKKCYTKVGNYKLALEAMENYSEIRDSIFNIESKKQIDELTTKYEVTQKETENQLLKEKQQAALRAIQYSNYLAVGLAFALLLAVGWGITFYRSNQRKRQYNKVLEQTVAERTNELNSANKKLALSNKELKQANYELRVFNYIASHDIKEPIRNIGSYASLIFRKLPEDLRMSLREYFDTIKNSTTQLYTLLEDFTKYTTLSRDDKIEKQEVDLSKLVDNIVNGSYDTIQKYNGKVIYGDLPVVQSSNSLLFTIIKNLIENGLKYNQSSTPTVEVSYYQTNKFHEIKVVDNGIGIDEDYHQKIFELFKQLNSPKEYGGSGTGLSIVKLCVEKLDGNIKVDSQEGKGSRFTIQLPI
jgi:signal transduction histidine kinase